MAEAMPRQESLRDANSGENQKFEKRGVFGVISVFGFESALRFLDLLLGGQGGA